MRLDVANWALQAFRKSETGCWGTQLDAQTHAIVPRPSSSCFASRGEARSSRRSHSPGPSSWDCQDSQSASAESEGVDFDSKATDATEACSDSLGFSDSLGPGAASLTCSWPAKSPMPPNIEYPWAQMGAGTADFTFKSASVIRLCCTTSSRPADVHDCWALKWNL